MNNTATTNPSAKNNARKSSKSTTQLIRERISNELIIGLCGAIGSGIDELSKRLKENLILTGYEIVEIKLSSLIIESSNLTVLPSLTEAERIIVLQDAGNQLREKHGKDFIAKLGIQQIFTKRTDEIIGNDDASLNSDVLENKTKKRVAYIINQLKHPEEVKLLRTVYPHNFYLISLIRTERERKLALEERNFSSKNIDDVVRKDRKEKDSWGQQVEKTSAMADYFMHNQHNHSENLNSEVTRFIHLVHGATAMSPRKEERGMSAAHSASLQSACLSRQVGAAIADVDGRILSTGCNDVPEFGGGLYTHESGAKDFRCVNKGAKCYNDHYKSRLKSEIEDVLIRNGLDAQKSKDISKSILEDTKAADLIEYSRAIHAEMDAITALARNSNVSTHKKILYCTTYPCHNCARHIVAAGIEKVVYIEPYEKSLALKLHDDAISDSVEDNKVHFQPYEGVSPARYNAFFKMSSPRKDNQGLALRNNIIEAVHVDPQYLDSYHAYEDKINEDLTNF